jgi:hypothetical protein
VLVDVVSGEMRAVQWKPGTTDTLEASPVKDSIMAVTDESYFDWPVLPEAPSSLDVMLVGGAAKLTWQVHGGNTTGIVVERQKEGVGAHKAAWERIANLGAASTEYSDSPLKKEDRTAYRVRAINKEGESAYSNVARVLPQHSGTE